MRQPHLYKSLLLILTFVVVAGCSSVNDNGSGELEQVGRGQGGTTVAKLAMANGDLSIGQRRQVELTALRAGFGELPEPKKTKTGKKKSVAKSPAVTEPAGEPTPSQSEAETTPATSAIASVPVDTTPATVAQAEPAVSAAPATQTATEAEPAADTAPEPEPEPVSTPSQPKKSETTPDTSTAKAEADSYFTAELQVVSPSGSRTYFVEVNSGATVEQLMKNARSQGFTYSTSGFSGMGSFVESVNGLSQDPRAGMYWIYFVNGQKSVQGISTRTLQKGDTIKWNYEKSY